uniref:Gypsy retrotransposon integrase-like protein 1 n=1 Tax=Denticeps clupeoides TaxID=299321 RepID=A0AAY4AM26_9TELE
MVMRAMHDDLGHLGQERTIDLIRSRFFWPKMSVDVEEYIKNCGECITHKTPQLRAASLHQIVTHGPMELVCMDFLSMEPDSKGISNVLVVTDHFTRYAQAYPTKSQKSHVVAKVLMEKFFVHYGLPARIHSDQGRDFESRLIRDLLTLMGIRKSRTTPYHPQGDPQPERFNRTLLSMLGTLGHEKKRTWSQHVGYLVHAYNSTKSDATGFSPYCLMFGREARLPVDLCFGTSPDGVRDACHLQYVSKLKEDLKQAYKLASDAANKRHQRNKRLYDQRVTFQSIEIGDRVLLRNLGLRGKHKLESRWSPDPYVVVGKMPNIPVFKIKREDGTRGIKTIHRDHLLPIGQLVRIPSTSIVDNSLSRPRTRRKSHRNGTETRTEPQEDQDFSDTSSDLEYFVTRHATREKNVPRIRNATETLGDMEDEDDSPLIQDTSQVDGTTTSESEMEDCRRTEEETSVVLEQNVDPELESEPELLTDSHSDMQNTRSECRPKRAVKPVVRLTYDGPGRSRDQPLTIVHRGIVIKIGQR